jgi:hypothetical protein
VHTVGATNLRGVLKFVSAHIKRFAKNDQVALDDVRRIAHQQGLRGVHHVIRRHAIVQPARRIGIANRFAHRHGESDHVMLHARFEFVDARHIHFRAAAQKGGSFFGNLPGLGKGVRGGKLNIEPLLVTVSVAPDAAHFFAGITWNHLGVSGDIHSNDTVFPD